MAGGEQGERTAGFSVPDEGFPGEMPDAVAIARICAALRERAPAIQAIPVQEMIDHLSRLARRWLDPAYPFRRAAEARLEAGTGFSLPVLRWGLDALFSVWTAEAMERLLRDELGDPGVLDGFVPVSPGGPLQRAVSPRLVTHILAGNVPPPAVQSLFPALLARAPGFVKASSSEPWFPHLLVASIEAEIPALRGCLACATWPGGDVAREAPLLEASDVVVAYGSNETLRSIAGRVRPPARFIGRGHRVSVGYLSREVLTPERAPALAVGIATDVAVFDQEGCLSPHVVCVERGGAVSPAELARMLARDAFPEVARGLPAGRMEAGQAAAVMQYKGVLAFTGELIEGPGFAVALTDAPRFEPSCLGRVVLVRPVADEREAGEYLEPVIGMLQGVALGAEEPRRSELAAVMAGWGASRICRPGGLQRPPAGWPNEGRPVVADLIHRVSLEP